MKSITKTFGNGWGSFTVTIEPKRSITVQRNDEKPITFHIGDECEESSYNLTYTGTILGITERNVMVKPQWERRTKRMRIESFAWRNWDFDAERIAQENFETSQYI